MSIALVIHIFCALVYLLYCGLNMICSFPDTCSGGWLVIQIMFFALEMLTCALMITHGVEVWNIVQRNCVYFKRIPNELIAPRFTYSPERKVPSDVSKYPTVDVIILCYKEDVDMVMQVVQAALDIQYPAQLLDVYVCDDGRDDFKPRAVAKLRRVEKYSNVHYITRPEHNFSKAGNVNHALKLTSGDLIVQLDADFITRPQLLQRLLPYYFECNDDTRLYGFNQTVSYVQISQ